MFSGGKRYPTNQPYYQLTYQALINFVKIEERDSEIQKHHYSTRLSNKRVSTPKKLTVTSQTQAI